LATPPQEGDRDRHPRETEWVPRGKAGVNFTASELGEHQEPVREPKTDLPAALLHGVE